MFSTNANLDKDVAKSVDDVIRDLTRGDIPQRIAEAARLAVARHMLQKSQEIQSAVEAENSTCYLCGNNAIAESEKNKNFETVSKNRSA